MRPDQPEAARDARQSGEGARVLLEVDGLLEASVMPWGFGNRLTLEAYSKYPWVLS